MISDDLTNREYHQLPSLSKSGLDLIAKSPKHFKSGGSKIGPETARIGTFTHAQILEDGAGLIVAPDRARASNDDRDWWQEWFADQKSDIDTTRKTGLKADEWFGEFENQTGYTIVKESEIDKCREIKQSIMANDLAAELLSEEGVVEQSILQTYNGIDVRCRPDRRLIKRHVMIDLKSTPVADWSKFQWSVRDYRYHVQDAFYSTLYHLEFGHWPDFYFIAVEKTAPWSCAVHRLGERTRAEGLRLMERDLETYRVCTESGIWPGVENNLDAEIKGIRDEFEAVDNLEELMA